MTLTSTSTRRHTRSTRRHLTSTHNRLPESLRREEIIIEPKDDLTGCKMMGEEVMEVLEYAPVSFM